MPSWYVSFTLKGLLIATIKIIIIIITIKVFLIFNMSEYFPIIFLGAHKPGACASADLAMLRARSPLPLAAFSRQSLTFPRTGRTGNASYFRCFWTWGMQHSGGGWCEVVITFSKKQRALIKTTLLKSLQSVLLLLTIQAWLFHCFLN